MSDKQIIVDRMFAAIEQDLIVFTPEVRERFVKDYADNLTEHYHAHNRNGADDPISRYYLGRAGGMLATMILLLSEEECKALIWQCKHATDHLYYDGSNKQ